MSAQPSTTFLVHGTDSPPIAPRPLRAGPLTLDYDHGDLRNVKFEEHEIIRRVGGAVRDRNWGTVPGVILEEQFEVSDSDFRIRYVSEHRQGDIHFVWHADLMGEADGSLRFEFEGVAKSTFLRNRIGLFVLHPVPECAGARVTAGGGGNPVRELQFPVTVSAEQPMVGFENLDILAHEVSAGIWTEVRFWGDVFETEDQRNWIDASYKTYGTPLRLPFPVEVPAGTRIRQRVEIRLTDHGGVPWKQASAEVAKTKSPVSIGLPTDTWVRLPDLGLGAASHGQPLTQVEVTRLAALNIGHLRAEVKLADPAWLPAFLAAARSANALGLPLELAVHLPADGRATEIQELRRELTRLRADVSRVLALQSGQLSTSTAALETVREYLGDLEVPIGVGAAADLYLLNLQRPPAGADYVGWSMNPQVHARDTRSLLETPLAAATQVARVRTYFPETPLVVSPITLRPRFNPVATGPESDVPFGGLPPQVDPRQLSLVGAAWTVAMLAALAPSGVESLTFFETTGWLGVMETAAGSPLPERFPSFAGGVFPVWHVFAALQGFRSVAAVLVGDPRSVAALAVTDRSGRKRLLLANLTPAPVSVCFGTIAGTVRLLDGAVVADAMRTPEAWWRQAALPLSGALSLSAYAMAFVDVTG
jgi:hypothetical protein